MPDTENTSSKVARGGAALLLGFAAVKLLLHVLTSSGYGWFRDELYYIACSDRLAFGYVDQPPFSLVLLRAARLFLGDSLLAVRLLPALAGAVTVLLVGLMARRLGGGRFAQALAMTSALVAPLYLGLDHFFSMNAFDMVLWALAACLLIDILGRANAVDGPNARLWIALGLILGIGLQNKISVLWLGFGIAAGLLLTSRRRLLVSRWPWLAGAVAVALFVPHVLWQVQNDWPTLEFMRNATGEKMARTSPLQFLMGQVVAMHPLNLPVWLAGLVFFLAHDRGRRFRPLGWTFVAILILLALSATSRASYLAPAYTWLFAGGGVVAERLLARLGWRWLQPVSLVLLLAGGTLTLPLAVPVLPVRSYVAYARALGFEPSTEEKKEVAELPQFYADMHGWEEIVATAASVYRSLLPDEQREACFFVPNYGDAGAIDLLGRRYGLPPALSGHNNYGLWGPRGCTGEVMIVLGGTAEDLLESFEEVERAATIQCGFCMPYENDRPVWIGRRFRGSLQEAWQDLRHYD
ncbi:MAG: ArnT family glycosyltransferase [Candidatus Krumholzibacteriia bacterium]